MAKAAKPSTKDFSPIDELGLAGLKPPAEPEGLSLDQLSSAFAEMLSSGDDPYEEVPAAEAEFEEAFGGAGSGEREPDEIVDTTPLTILEAMLFVGTPDNRPLTARQVASLMRGVRPAEIEQLVDELNARYAEDHCPYQIISDGAGYRLALREEFCRVRDKFYGRARQVTLSQAAIEVLSIVAYDQPVTTEQVTKRRGTASGTILSQLVRRELLRLERSSQGPRISHYWTTERFLQLFGLRSLEDLPRSQDLDKQ